jgi:iron complex transport system substrate-binding protein
MEAELKRIGDIGASIADKKSVYFEISAAPYMYSFGRGVFLNEMIELIGARNIFADQVSWMPVGDEAVPAANPDCVLTNVDYMDDPIGEIMSRSGWDAITAVKNSAVYQIDANASSRASHHIIKALNEMAKAVYPELYK